jgi:hypothetical protein
MLSTVVTQQQQQQQPSVIDAAKSAKRAYSSSRSKHQMSPPATSLLHRRHSSNNSLTKCLDENNNNSNNSNDDEHEDGLAELDEGGDENDSGVLASAVNGHEVADCDNQQRPALDDELLVKQEQLMIGDDEEIDHLNNQTVDDHDAGDFENERVEEALDLKQLQVKFLLI